MPMTSKPGPFLRTTRGFTLVELLVVVAVIALLMGVLLPALSRARESAQQLKSSANLRSIGQGVSIYTAGAEYFPPSYVYGAGTTGTNWNIKDQIQENPNPMYGYIHWSYSLLESEAGGVAEEAFTCPKMLNGGAPRTNPGKVADGWEAWQVDSVGGQRGSTSDYPLDRQAKRMAYTGNAAIFPRNKFTQSAGANRLNQLVRPSWVKASGSRVILATEFLEAEQWQSISKDSKSKSHRPVSPFWCFSGTGDAIYSESEGGSSGRFYYPTESMIKDKFQVGAQMIEDGDTELNAVGRYWGGGDTKYGGTTNFVFVDGHCEKMSVIESIRNRLWGDKFYSLTGANTQVPLHP